MNKTVTGCFTYNHLTYETFHLHLLTYRLNTYGILTYSFFYLRYILPTTKLSLQALDLLHISPTFSALQNDLHLYLQVECEGLEEKLTHHLEVNVVAATALIGQDFGLSLLITHVVFAWSQFVLIISAGQSVQSFIQSFKIFPLRAFYAFSLFYLLDHYFDISILLLQLPEEVE